MSLDAAPKLTRKRAIAFNVQSSTGTPATLTNTDGVTAFFSPSLKKNTEKVQREKFGGLSPIVQAFGARGATVKFRTEIVGSGASGVPIWTRLLQGCGYSPSAGVWSPVDGATNVLTFNFYEDGRMRQVSDAMGTFVATLRRGQRGVIDWTFTGIRQPDTDTALIAPTYPTVQPPHVGATTFTVGGSTYRVPEIVIDAGNTVILREDVTGKDSANAATGYRAAYITDRNPTIKLSPESLAIATVDWQGTLDAATLLALVCTWGTNANNTFSFAAPHMQLNDDSDLEDRQGMMADGLTFLALGSTPGAHDELTLTLS